MFRRRRITWEAVDWAGFFTAGGVLTVDAWERATKESRAACVMAVSFMQAGGIEEDETAPVVDVPVATKTPFFPTLQDEIRSIGGKVSP